MGRQAALKLGQGEGHVVLAARRMEPLEEAAEAIVEYATKHAASESGQVPYREWPQGVKGHFVTRMAPLPADDA